MPTQPSSRETVLGDLMRSGDADAIVATIVVAAGLIVCAMTWQPPADARPESVAHHEAVQSRLRSSLVSFTDGPDRVAVALPDE